MRPLASLAAVTALATLGAWPTSALVGNWERPFVDPGVRIVTLATAVMWIIVLRTWAGLTIAALAMLPRLRHLAPVGHRLIPALLRPVLLGGIGLGVAATAACGITPAAGAPTPGWTPTSPGWNPSTSEPDPPSAPRVPETTAPRSPAPERPGDRSPGPESPGTPPRDRPGATEPRPDDTDERGPHSPGTAIHLVKSGDSLWRIVEDRLGPGSSNEDIARGVVSVHQANRDAIGANPDRLNTGTRIEVTLP